MSTVDDRPDLSLGEFLPVTESAAIASGRWLGRGDNHSADQAAVDAMRREFSKLNISGRVVIGEGEKDKAPQLYNGEEVGAGGMAVDIGVDPLEGTDLVSRGDEGAIAICVIAERGGILSAPDMYMRKLCVGATAKGKVDITAPIAETMGAVAESYGRDVQDITAIVLDRPRHEQLIAEIRETGARIRLIPDGDITASMSAAVRGTGDHVYIGSGGSTEGVITAAALECLGGEIQAQFAPNSENQVAELAKFGVTDLEKVLSTTDLASAPLYVIATGVTDGNLLRGVRYFAGGARTHSIALNLRRGTIRFIDTVHLLDGKPAHEIRLSGVA